MHYPKVYDVIVIGGGHAGTEAALAAARMGRQTLLLTHNIETLGQMSCNPAIGGIGKSHLVREIDALGGAMAKATDLAGIQFRTLNSSKGPAVRATRAQADRVLYKAAIRSRLENQTNLDLFQQAAADLIMDGDRVAGIVDPRERSGSYAEYVAAPVAALAPAPATFTLQEAAAYPTVAVAAWRYVVGAADVRPGDRVLVHGGAGGVGSMVVQLAKARGAHDTIASGTARGGADDRPRGLHRDLRVLGEHAHDLAGTETGRVAREAYLLGPSLTGVLTRMERDGLIERSRCPQDARRTVVRATALGLSKVQALSQSIEAHYSWMEQQLGKAKLGQLYALLDEVIALETPDTETPQELAEEEER